MAANSLFWDTNMAAVTSCENTLYRSIEDQSQNLREQSPNYCLFPRNPISSNLFVLDIREKYTKAGKHF